MTIAIDLSKLVTAEAQNALALESAKAAARATLTAYIIAARSMLITVLPGQEMIYQAKEAEALAWVAAEAPGLTDYPLLSAEIGITAPDADQLAQLWLNMARIWRDTAAGLEALRLSIGAAIDAATQLIEVEIALAPITQPQE